jgi:uncharacterized protein YecE (DUF72 family)
VARWLRSLAPRLAPQSRSARVPALGPGSVAYAAGMGQIRVGTASWTDRTLLESGWYPPEAATPDTRLRYYARQFPLVEVDATYYALPAEPTAAAWAARTPPGFTFNIKAFSLLTGHPTRPGALPKDLPEAAQQAGKDPVYLRQVDPAVTGQVWDRFVAALEPLHAAGKLGALLFQFSQWFPIPGGQGLPPGLRAAGRAPPGVHRVPQPHLDDAGQPAGEPGVPGPAPGAVRVRGHAAGVPQLHPASSAGRHREPGGAPPARPLRQVGQQGHPRTVRYRYTNPELAEWAPKIRGLAGRAEVTQVLFNNCYRDYAQVNAQHLAELLGA